MKKPFTINFRSMGDEIHLSVALSSALKEGRQLTKTGVDEGERQSAKSRVNTILYIAALAKKQGYDELAKEILDK